MLFIELEYNGIKHGVVAISAIAERWLKMQPETSGAVHLCQCVHL